MGQAASKCRGISDEEVLLYTKQYFTISKIVDILVDLENGKTLTELNPKDHMINITTLIPYPPPNLDIYLKVYKPTEEIRGIEAPEKVSLTYLHKYNEFVTITNKNMTIADRKIKASEIRSNLVNSMGELLKFITDSCGDVGIQE